MNQFEALGIASRAHVGGRVLVVYAQVEQIRHAVDLVAEQAKWITEKVTVVHKRMEERVEVGALGGEVVFTFRRSTNLDDSQADAVLVIGAPSLSEAERDKYAAIARGGPVISR